MFAVLAIVHHASATPCKILKILFQWNARQSGFAAYQLITNLCVAAQLMAKRMLDRPAVIMTLRKQKAINMRLLREPPDR